MTRQEIFDKVVSGLRSQGFKRSFIPKYNACMYRHKDENDNLLKCAAGHLIKDEDYEPSFEHNVCVTGPLKDYLLSCICDNDNSKLFLIRDLQIIHDKSSDDPQEMELKLREFGQKLGLNWPT